MKANSTSIWLVVGLCWMTACGQRANGRAGSPVQVTADPRAVPSSEPSAERSAEAEPAVTSAAAGSGGSAAAGSNAQTLAGRAATGAAGAAGAVQQPTSAGQSAPQAGTGAAGGPMVDEPVAPTTILGADISSVHENNYVFVDTDGETKSVFELLQNHGFNYIRVKTFVDPAAPHGYASREAGCMGFSEPFSDRDHVVAFGQKIKAAGMGFLLDFHYSDTWADPGKQHIPEAWRDAKTIAELAARLKAYTKDVLQAAIAAGARPDMVQIGNEITPGMLMHVPGDDTDCWGNMPDRAAVSGSADSWEALGALLRAGIEATREVDPAISVMLHIENTEDLPGVMSWVNNAMRQGVELDVLGLSCYTAFQGEPSVWAATFEALADAYPKLKFVIAEYNPERTQANLMMHELPEKRGLGTFLWEPTRSGAWGKALFSQRADTLTANAADFAEIDALRPMLGL